MTRQFADLQDVESQLSRVDWSATPLGPVIDWDMRLRTMAGFVFRSAPPICLFWGAKGSLIFNTAWEEGLGPLQSGTLGRSVAEVQDGLARAYADALSPDSAFDRPDFAAALTPMMWRLMVDRPGSTLSCRAVPGDGPGQVAGILVQRRTGPASAPDLQNRSAFLLRLSDTMRRLDDPEEIQTVGTRMLGEMLWADRASFAEVDLAAGFAWENCDYRRDPEAPSQASTFKLSDAGPSLDLLKNGMPLMIRDVRAPDGSPSDEVAAEVLGYSVAPFRAQLTVPVMRLDALASVMTVRFDAPHDWTPDELAIVHDAALRIWEAMERGRAEAALARTQARHRALFESIDEGVCLFERLPLRPDGLRDYRYISMNPAMQTMFGIPDLSGQSIRANFLDEIEDWYDDYDRVLDTGEPIRIVRGSVPQGMVLEMFVARVEGLDGKVLLAVMQDVTARVRAEEALRTNERKLREVLDGKDEAFGLMDNEFRIITQNRAALALDGRPIEEIVGRTHWEVYPGTEDSEIGRLYKRALAEQAPVSLEHRYEWPDGHGVTWLDMRAFPVPEGLAVFWRDITQRKKVEEALRSSELRLRLAQKAAGIATFDFEVGSRTVTWSPEAIGMLGLRPGDLGGSYEDWIRTTCRTRQSRSSGRSKMANLRANGA